MTIFESLRAKFERNAISWRAQSLTRNGDKAMALAYIDARDVMNRLDDVCGPADWQDSYVETASGRVICTISIMCGTDWVSKADGAGNTDVEGDKGGISDAFKRAAVKWGIGRYLYDIEAPWVPCETYENNQGKKVWKRWTADPWSCIRQPGSEGPRSKPEALKGVIKTRDAVKRAMDVLIQDIRAAPDRDALDILCNSSKPLIDQIRDEMPNLWNGDGGEWEGLDTILEQAYATAGKPDEHTEEYRGLLTTMRRTTTRKGLNAWMVNNLPEIDKLHETERDDLRGEYKEFDQGLLQLEIVRGG